MLINGVIKMGNIGWGISEVKMIHGLKMVMVSVERISEIT